jgi:hypothetical protein
MGQMKQCKVSPDKQAEETPESMDFFFKGPRSQRGNMAPKIACPLLNAACPVS